MDQEYSNSIFWIEVNKIRPNPYQPRMEFNEDRLRELAESIRQYGILQPLVVTRHEVVKEDGGMEVQYELISGERRFRASKIAGLMQVPSIIRSGEQTDKMKLEMAIIENLQREDLNPIERAKAFSQLAKEFNLTHAEIAKKVGKSREYVSNSIRLLLLPEEMIQAIPARKISEGHSRPLLMLSDRPEEQMTLFKEIVSKALTVREAEQISRRIATDKLRRKDHLLDPQVLEMETQLSERYGTRVRVEKKDQERGKISIDFYSEDDLNKILQMLSEDKEAKMAEVPEEKPLAENTSPIEDTVSTNSDSPVDESQVENQPEPVQTDPDEDLYSLKDFSV